MAEDAERVLAPARWPVPWEPVEGDRDGALARLEAAATLSVLRVLGRLPARGQDAVAAALAWVARKVDRRHSDAASRYLEQALPALDADGREALVRAAWRHLFTVVLRDQAFDREVPRERLLERCEYRVCPDFERLLASGSGSIFAMAHLGCWEFLPAFVGARGVAPLYAVSRPPRNRPLSRYAQARRDSRGLRLLHRHGAMASIPRIVAAGGHVGMLVDQRGRHKPLQVPFFGRTANCERGIAVLVKRVRVPVVLAACFERPGEPWRFVVEVPEVIWPAELAGRTPEEVTLRLNRALERMILARPEQYLWLHDRYRNAPSAAGAAAS